MFHEAREYNATDMKDSSPEVAKSLDCPPVRAQRKESIGVFSDTQPADTLSNAVAMASFRRAVSSGSDSRPIYPHRRGSIDSGGISEYLRNKSPSGSVVVENPKRPSRVEPIMDSAPSTSEESDGFFDRFLPVFTVSAVSTLSGNHSATAEKKADIDDDDNDDDDDDDDDDDETAHRRDSAASRLESLMRGKNRSSFLSNRPNFLAKSVFRNTAEEAKTGDSNTEGVVPENDKPASIYCRVAGLVSSATSSVTGGSDGPATPKREQKTWSMKTTKGSAYDRKPRFPRRGSLGMVFSGSGSQKSENSPRPMDESNQRVSVVSAPPFFPSLWRRGSMTSSVTFDDQSILSDYEEDPSLEMYPSDKMEAKRGLEGNSAHTSHDSTPCVPSRRESMSTGGSFASRAESMSTGCSLTSRRDSLSAASSIPRNSKRDNMSSGSNSSAPRKPGRRGSMTVGEPARRRGSMTMTDFFSGRHPGRRASVTTSLQESFPELSPEEETLAEEDPVGKHDSMESRRFCLSLDSMPEEGGWSSSEESISFGAVDGEDEEDRSSSLLFEASPEELQNKGDVELAEPGNEESAGQATESQQEQRQMRNDDKTSETCTTSTTSSAEPRSRKQHQRRRSMHELSRSSSDSMKTKTSSLEKDSRWMIAVKENMSTMFISAKSLTTDQPKGGRRIEAHNSLLALFRSA